MGNRANVVFVAEGDVSPAVYLHWNGGPESVYAFLNELNRRKVRADANYECASFIGIVNEYFNQDSLGTTSLGVANGPSEISVEALKKVQIDSGDNGFYIVDRTGKEMVVRRFTEHYDKLTETFTGLGEMTADEVKDEHKTAMEHAYNKGKDTLADAFVKIQGDRNRRPLTSPEKPARLEL